MKKAETVSKQRWPCNDFASQATVAGEHRLKRDGLEFMVPNHHAPFHNQGFDPRGRAEQKSGDCIPNAQ
jgi:hypothetical protein